MCGSSQQINSYDPLQFTPSRSILCMIAEGTPTCTRCTSGSSVREEWFVCRSQLETSDMRKSSVPRCGEIFCNGPPRSGAVSRTGLSPTSLRRAIGLYWWISESVLLGVSSRKSGRAWWCPTNWWEHSCVAVYFWVSKPSPTFLWCTVTVIIIKQTGLWCHTHNSAMAPNVRLLYHPHWYRVYIEDTWVWLAQKAMNTIQNLRVLARSIAFPDFLEHQDSRVPCTPPRSCIAKEKEYSLRPSLCLFLQFHMDILEHS